MPNSVAIRLAVEGGSEVKRVLDEAGRAGQAAFQGVGAAADAAGVATDRQTAKFQKLAQAAREAEAQARAQANVNALLGVGGGAGGSARDSASVFEAQARAADEARTRSEALAREVANLQSRFDPAAAAASRYAAALDDIARAERMGVISSDAAAAARAREAQGYEAAAARISGATTSVRTATDGWRALGNAGSATLAEIETMRGRAAANAEASRRLGSLGVGPQAANENAARRLRDDEVKNLMFQGGDVVAQLGSGSPLSMIALQQGPQIAQMFAGPGGASVKGAFAQAGEAVSTFASRIGVVGGAFGGLAVAAGIGVAALISYRSEQQETEKAIGGMGRTAGVTLDAINRLAEAQTSGLSRSATRELAASYASAGNIGPEILGGALGVTRDLAKFLGTDPANAATILAGALGNTSRGAGELARQYGLLNDVTAESVRRMAEQGDRLGAQQKLLAAVRESVEGLAEAPTGWARLTAGISNLWDGLGQVVDRAVTGGDLEARLKTAREALAETRAEAVGANSFYRQNVLDPRIATFEKDVADLQKQLDAREALAKRLQAAQRSVEVGSLVRALLPDQAALQKIQDQAERLRRELAEPWKIGLDARGVAEVETAIGRLGRLFQTTFEDIRRYGTTEIAGLVRAAEHESRTVGATPYGREAANIEERFQNALRKANLDPTETRRAAEEARSDYNRRLSDPNIGAADGRALTAAREASQQSLRELEGLERARDQQLANLRRQTSLDLVGVGGAFSRMTPEVQAQLQAGGQRFNRIPIGVAAAVAQIESRGNLDVGYTKILDENGRRGTAYGLGQITRTTGDDLQRRYGIDRMNRATMGEALMGVLDMKLDATGGDLTRALMAYRGSRNPAVNRAYAAEVMRNAGQLGDASALGIVRDQDGNVQALTRANDNVKALTENYGKNGAALESQTRAMEQYRAMLARGVPAAEAASVAFGGLADKLVSAERAGRLIQATRDDDFAREQLGRTRADQTAYARARQLVGDTTSNSALAVIDQSRQTTALTEARATFSDVFGSVVSDLRRGADAASVATNALGRFADKLVSNVIDRAASAFTGSLASSGGSAGILGLLGFDRGGYTGPGGRHDVAGFVHRGEVVFSQDDVRRHGGVGVVEMMRRGLPGYDGGGPVGGYTMPSRMAGGAPANGSTPVPVTVIDNVGTRVSAQETQDGRGGRRLEVTLDEATAGAVGRPGSKTAAALRQPQVGSR